MKTYSAKPTDVTRAWHLVDASGQTLGRLATIVAVRLQGKHKPIYTAHIDCGDNVVVINAARIHVTGGKLEDKKYYRHSGYPGGIKEINLADQLAKDPTAVIRHAVGGMLPKNRLAADRLNRLKIYATAEHPHQPQAPQKLEIN
ncbi:MAG TPA: 50S ribosomal protein L13 [Candidatus Saccharimonadales bacterium]|nr:50S ribosomal protein L13 [Candidatus Saccharimonadales bacterium]